MSKGRQLARGVSFDIFGANEALCLSFEKRKCELRAALLSEEVYVESVGESKPALLAERH
jgi:hypothetical protein